MTEAERDAAIAVHQAEIARLREVKCVAGAPPVSLVDHLVETPTDLIKAAAAAALARRAKSTIGAWCRKNAIDGQKGFSIKLGARWYVSKSRLKKHLGCPRAI
jgi:hypothetical protein